MQHIGLSAHLSLSRCIKLALVHDMAECIVGDIAPSDNVSKAEKHRREEARDQQHLHYIYTQQSVIRSPDLLINISSCLF